MIIRSKNKGTKKSKSVAGPKNGCKIRFMLPRLLHKYVGLALKKLVASKNVVAGAANGKKGKGSYKLAAVERQPGETVNKSKSANKRASEEQRDYIEFCVQQ